jgi:hypothetical protein
MIVPVSSQFIGRRVSLFIALDADEPPSDDTVTGAIAYRFVYLFSLWKYAHPAALRLIWISDGILL